MEGAGFDLAQWEHRALYNAALGRIEMHLVSLCDQRVSIPGLRDLHLEVPEGRHLRTEISTKFTSAQVEAELAAAGLAVHAAWTDRSGDFQLTLARRDRLDAAITAASFS